MHVVPVEYNIIDVFCYSERGLMLHNNRVAPVNSSALPTVQDALRHYNSLGGALTEPHTFGDDPLNSNQRLQQIRQDLFKERFPSFESLFSSVVAGNHTLFKEGLLFYIETTKRLSHGLYMSFYK